MKDNLIKRVGDKSILLIDYDDKKGEDNMRFRIETKCTAEDYLDWNMFWMNKSPYAKRQMVYLRIMLTLIVCIIAFSVVRRGGFSSQAWLRFIFMMLLTVPVQLLLPLYFKYALKRRIKRLEKTGKRLYSPEAVIEFYDDIFVETTPESKIEQKYSSIDRISIVSDKMIYIHINNTMVFILPVRCFESRQQYESFLEFIKTRGTFTKVPLDPENFKSLCGYQSAAPMVVASDWY